MLHVIGMELLLLLQVLEIDNVRAWKSVLISVTSYALGLFMIAKVPWHRLLLAWAWTGTTVTGVKLSSTVSSLSRLANYCCLSALFFVIGHDCAHKSFSQNKLVEDIVGTLGFLPLVCLSTTVITPKLTCNSP